MRLGQIGAEEEEGEGDGASQLQPSQDKDDEDERAGKLKNGPVQLCNGEVFFIMDVSFFGGGGIFFF